MSLIVIQVGYQRDDGACVDIGRRRRRSDILLPGLLKKPGHMIADCTVLDTGPGCHVALVP